MYQIQSMRKDVLHYSVSHWDRHTCSSESTVQKKILQDLHVCNYTVEDFYNHRCILSFINEGHDIGDLDAVIRFLDGSHGRSRYAILVSAQNHNRPTQDPVYCFPESLVNHGGFFDRIKRHPPTAEVKLTKKFLCLIRRAAPSRAQFASVFSQPDLRPYVAMSFGCHHYASELQTYQPLFPTDSLPILLDGRIAEHTADRVFDVEDSWYGCLFNCVAETSNQTDPGSFRSIFVTEKTYKAFAMCQIPIWFAVPGVVAQIRNLGFDLFDDIVDHSYDSIHDQNSRLTMLHQQIKTLHQRFSLDQCQATRDSLWTRLYDNYKRISALEQTFQNKFVSFTDKFIDHACKNIDYNR